jgi:hypothetical protein
VVGHLQHLGPDGRRAAQQGGLTFPLDIAGEQGRLIPDAYPEHQ